MSVPLRQPFPDRTVTWCSLTSSWAWSRTFRCPRTGHGSPWWTGSTRSAARTRCVDQSPRLDLSPNTDYLDQPLMRKCLHLHTLNKLYREREDEYAEHTLNRHIICTIILSIINKTADSFGFNWINQFQLTMIQRMIRSFHLSLAHLVRSPTQKKNRESWFWQHQPEPQSHLPYMVRVTRRFE